MVLLGLSRRAELPPIQASEAGRGKKTRPGRLCSERSRLSQSVLHELDWLDPYFSIDNRHWTHASLFRTQF